MGRVVHFEIPSDKPEELVEFYKKTFGWTIEKWADMDYWLVDTGLKENPGINGAITKRSENLQTVVNTINVDDIKKSISTIKKNGGEVLTEIMDIPKVGKFVYFKDLDGNISGILEGSAEM